MKSRIYSSLILSFILFVSCNEREIDFVPGVVYRVTTTEGEGFAMFEPATSRRWKGVYYLDENRLKAVPRIVSLKAGKDYVFVDGAGKVIPVLSYCVYKTPAFMDYPETWAYRDSVYSVSVTEDVIYGRAQGYWVSYPDTGGSYMEIFERKLSDLDCGRSNLDLTMDVYLPNDDETASRPLLVLLHGGAFFNGDKTDKGFPEWAQYFAGMGYAVVSVNYRLGFRLNPVSVVRAGFRGVQDVDAAIRYVIKNRSIYNVDPDRVFVAGTSAGGITALNVAFMRDYNIPFAARGEGGIHAVNPEMREPYSIRGIGNLWGAVNDISILDNSLASVISFQSTGDPVVPFGKGHPFENVFFNKVVFPTVYGSGQITEYLGNQRATLKSFDLPGRHTLHFDKDENEKESLNSCFVEIKVAMRDFFSKVMMPSPVVVEHADQSQIFQVKSSDIDSVYWNVQGGVILKQSGCIATVLLFSDATSHSVIASGKYKSGLTFRQKWDL